MSKKKSIVISVILAVVVITMALFIFPLNGKDCWELGKYDVYWVSKSIKLGLDLEGGMYVVYDMDLDDIEESERDTAIEGTMSNLEALLFSKGYTEATVTRQGSEKIRVEIPSVSDTESLMNLIGEPAELEFRDEDGNVLIEGGKHLQDASATLYDGSYAVSLTFNDAGTEAFAKATSENLNKTIGIYINGEKVIEPTVNSTISDGNAVITGNYTQTYANELAIKLKAGTFAVKLSPSENATISATLGNDALISSIIAGAIGLGVIIIFMLIVYKGMGVIASFALIIYTILMMYALALVPWVQLTLPSIAGMILSIGMAVDANVIVFERIKDERGLLGKPIPTAVQVGFKKALPAIIDGNVTTIIGSIVMIIFGASSIRSFGITLLIGILLSMFTALLVTRLLFMISLSFNDDSDRYYSLKVKKTNEGEVEA